MAKDNITLNECTKADLIWIIKRILQMTAFGSQNHYLMRALADLNYEKEKQALDDAEKIAALADQCRMEYIEILAPYDGKPIKDIPLEILDKAAEAMDTAQALDKKWNKLMGF